jgi:glycerol kinase
LGDFFTNASGRPDQEASFWRSIKTAEIYDGFWQLRNGSGATIHQFIGMPTISTIWSRSKLKVRIFAFNGFLKQLGP